MDAPRKLLLDALARRPGLTLDKLSVAIGRNHAYLHQYLMRGTPRELPEPVRRALAPLVGVPPDSLAPGPAAASLEETAPAGPADPTDLPVYSTR